MKINLLIVIFFLQSLIVFSKDVQVVQKEIVRLLQVNPNSKLNIYNRNGDVNFELWQKNEVEVKVILEVESPRVQHLTRYIQAITIHETKNGDEHNFVSKIDQSKLDASFRTGKSKYKINYFIKYPVYLNLNIVNKFGDIIIDEISGNISIKLDFGSLNIKNITSDENKKIPQITLNYSDGVVNKTNFLDVQLGYSKLIVNESKSLILNTKFSDVEIQNAHIIKITSKYDKYIINNISKINSNSNFSDIKISTISNFADIYATYGNIFIQKIPAEFTEGIFDIKFLDLDIFIDNDACFQIYSNLIFSDIILPKKSEVDNYITFKDKRINGTIGCKTGANGKLDIRSEYSDIIISQ